MVSLHYMAKWFKSLVGKAIRCAQAYYAVRFNSIYIAKGTYLAQGTKIGKFTRINAISHLGVCEVGAYCAIGGRLIVRSTDHYTNYLNMQSWAQEFVIKSPIKVDGKSKGKVRIGNGVWIGDSVIILPGVVVGDGAIIGAGSVVTKSVPPYSVVVGNPAKVIKMRFSKEVVDCLLKLDWWRWDIKKIRENRRLFELDMSKADCVEELEKMISKLSVRGGV